MSNKSKRQKVIALSGKKGIGKTFVANQIASLLPAGSCEVLSYASPIKEALAAFGVSFDNKEEIQEPFGVTPRWMAQTFGTEWARTHIKDSIFIDIMTDKISKSDAALIIIDDCRFDNEAEAIDSIGGTIFRITGESVYDTGSTDQHASEAGVSDHLVYATVANHHDGIHQASPPASKLIWKALLNE